MAIRILLVDDHTVLREGIAKLLDAQADMRVVASTGDGREAIRFSGDQEIDVAIVDVAMPGINGIDIVPRMLEAAPGMQVVMLSMYANPEYVCRALQAGAMGYVLKDSAGRTVRDAVRAVHSGQRYLGNGIDAAAMARYQRAQSGDGVGLLSLREREVLKLTVDGSSIADTAKLLGVSSKTIETYRYRLMSKLGIDNLPALVKFAIRHGVTTLD